MRQVLEDVKAELKTHKGNETWKCMLTENVSN